MKSCTCQNTSSVMHSGHWKKNTNIYLVLCISEALKVDFVTLVFKENPHEEAELSQMRHFIRLYKFIKFLFCLVLFREGKKTFFIGSVACGFTAGSFNFNKKNNQNDKKMAN